MGRGLTMATECSQQAILDFLRDRGGKVKNTDLIQHFTGIFPEEPEERAAVRNAFKNYVDSVAFVKTDSGVKYVCLRKKFRPTLTEHRDPDGTNGAEEPHPDALLSRYPAGPGRADCCQVRGDDAAEDPALPRAAGGRVQQQILPGSGYGNDSQVRVPPDFNTASVLSDETEDKTKWNDFVCIVEDVDGGSGDMGNRSFRAERRESEKHKDEFGNTHDVPQIAVIEASPLPAEESVFALPEPVQTGGTGQVPAAPPGADPKAETDFLSLENSKEAELVHVVTRRRDSSGSLVRSTNAQSDDGEEDAHLDTCSWSGSEGTPKGSRKHFIEVMMNSSPQVRRSLVLRGSLYLPSRSDSDTGSLVSVNVDDDRTSVALDPLEHEWMMCASDGEWASLHRLLSVEPGLLLRKDFVTGFTCLHWAAKHGKPELIAMIINFGKQHDVPVSVDVRSNSGYTPLHVAAMHNRMEVVKLLVGAYNADVDARDYSGRKACQYLTDDVSLDIRDIIGAYEHSDLENADTVDGGRWRFSKALQSNLRPLRLLSPNQWDSVDGEPRPREKPVRRKSSLSKMKPKLQKLRWRTSQIVHSVSFRDKEDLEGSEKGSIKSRPKTHFFDETGRTGKFDS